MPGIGVGSPPNGETRPVSSKYGQRMAEVLGVVLHWVRQLTSLCEHYALKALILPTVRGQLRYSWKAPGVAITTPLPAAVAPIRACQGDTNLQVNALATSSAHDP